MTEGECSQLHSLINNAETVVLCCHVNADGDALGSMLGWGGGAACNGQGTVGRCPGPVS